MSGPLFENNRHTLVEMGRMDLELALKVPRDGRAHVEYNFDRFHSGFVYLCPCLANTHTGMHGISCLS